VEYKYEYVIYNGLRRAARQVFEDLAMGRPVRSPLFQVKPNSDTVELRRMGLPIDLNKAIPSDIAKVLKEAFLELGKAQVQRLQRRWSVIEVRDVPDGSWVLKDLAAQWRRAPQRRQERVAANAKRREMQRGWWYRIYQRALRALGVTGIILLLFGAAVLLLRWLSPWGNNLVTLVGALASILGLGGIAWSRWQPSKKK